MFYHRFFFFLLSFFICHTLKIISELAEPNLTISGHMVGSKCDWKMHVQNLGYPFYLQIAGPETTLFRWFCNLRATLMAYVFGIKHDIRKQASALQTTSFLYHLRTTWTLVHKRLKIGGKFSPTLRKFSIPLHCQASQTEISKQNSTKLFQTVDSRSR